MRSLRYAVEEALVSFRRSRQSAAMSIGTIAIAFLTLAGFLLASANLQTLVNRWASAAEMSIYLRDDADDAVREALLTETRARPGVTSVEFVSKDMAIERFRAEFPELGDVAASAQNPFPASIEVRLQPDPASAHLADAMASDLSARPGVADVRYDGKWLTRVTDRRHRCSPWRPCHGGGPDSRGRVHGGRRRPVVARSEAPGDRDHAARGRTRRVHSRTLRRRGDAAGWDRGGVGAGRPLVRVRVVSYAGSTRRSRRSPQWARPDFSAGRRWLWCSWRGVLWGLWRA